MRTEGNSRALEHANGFAILREEYRVNESKRSPDQRGTAIRRLLEATVFLAVLAPHFESIAADHGSWKIGAYEFAVYEIDLTHDVSLDLSAQDLRRKLELLTDWGGIVIQSRAVRDASLKNRRIEISFVGDQDGQNLKLSIGDANFYIGLYDWQLIPIALFVDSDQTGVLTTTYAADGRGEPIRFHRAFKDRLIGMRLLQAYFMIANPEGMWPMAEYKSMDTATPKIVRGPGEKPLPPKKTRTSSLRKYTGSRYGWESWDDLLVSEPGVPVRIALVRDRPARGGEVRLRLLGKVETTFWSAEDVKVGSRATRLDRLSSDTAHGLTSLRNVNPAAMDALDNLHQFSALFRLVKEESPGSWSSFMVAIRKAETRVDLAPVRTPSSQK